jgi:hypothetical protein
MIILVIVGMVTIFGVVIIAAIETRRMEKGQPSILSSEKSDKANKES